MVKRITHHKFIDGVEHKYCSQCDEYKTINNFNKHKRAKDGLQGYCCKCRKKNREKNRVLKNKPHVPHKFIDGVENKYCGKCDKFHVLNDFRIDKRKWDNKKLYCREYWRQYAQTARYKERRRMARMTAKHKNRKNAYCRKKYAEDLEFRISHLIRGRLYMALKAKGVRKTTSTLKLCGCSLEKLKQHIENQFYDGMSWEKKNFHIDHMEPCVLFNLADEEEQRKCFHYTNLKPEWPSQNMSDGGRKKWNMEWNGERWIVHGRL